MQDGLLFLAGDSHCKKLDVSKAKEYFGKIDVGIFLGDVFDEHVHIDDRHNFFNELKKDICGLFDHVIVLQGNHDVECIHYEEKYMNLTQGQINKMKNFERKRELPLRMAEIPKNKMKFTEDLLKELGDVESYVCINTDGEVLRASDDIEAFPEFSNKRYDLYVAAVEDCPKMVLYDKNSRVHLLSHHQNLSLFDDEFLDYFHGHYHGSYKNGDQISSTIFRRRPDGGWAAAKSFSYKFESGELKGSIRHTPCISFFLDEKKCNARLELVPGIYGDWMVYDRGGSDVFYWSKKRRWVKEIDVGELFSRVLGRAGIEGCYRLSLA